MKWERVALEVCARFSRDGEIAPLSVVYDERVFTVDRILSKSRRAPAGVACINPIQYSAVICGCRKFIYYEPDSGTWFSVRAIE